MGKLLTCVELTKMSDLTLLISVLRVAHSAFCTARINQQQH